VIGHVAAAAGADDRNILWRENVRFLAAPAEGVNIRVLDEEQEVIGGFVLLECDELFLQPARSEIIQSAEILVTQHSRLFFIVHCPAIQVGSSPARCLTEKRSGGYIRRNSQELFQFMPQPSFTPPWFVRKDLDGFFGLMIDNLIQLILIVTLCRELIHLPDEYIFGRILPGAAISILFGNFFYAWQARRLARETGREDVTALPYGINTVSLFAFVFFKRPTIPSGRGSWDWLPAFSTASSKSSPLLSPSACARRPRGRRCSPLWRASRSLLFRWISLLKFSPGLWSRWCRWR
jgi:hypothetical protein